MKPRCEVCKLHSYAEKKTRFTDRKTLAVAHRMVSRLEGISKVSG